ncbi:unnamed protein product [Notodromas monacha]|uniref:GDP-fucose protein O-fucosyltransferase 2 n=1 Tax=Notodromas monacha TaxID=399045 RepID=A0A7R9BUI5_9CRUS|nr:unnamed protein product [Notodromas monacha]CAG0920989.1 unnamed protein product [Notodromas monacha]
MASEAFPQLTKRAPDFKGKAVVNGVFKDISLDDYKGKYLVLFFYPLDFTFVCPTEIIAFSERAEEFRKIGCEVIACSTDSVFSHLGWINTPRKQGGLGPMDIPLLADQSGAISKAYGVYKADECIAFRGLFIIDDKQNLRQITINDLPVGRDVGETLRLVQAFQFTDKNGEVSCIAQVANWGQIRHSRKLLFFRYLLYGVNPGEGFNLSRDVYLRLAAVVRKLVEDDDWTLVLPPWGPTYHWRKAEELSGKKQFKIRWSEFFDVSSLKRFIPVIELENFISIAHDSAEVDIVYVLQRFSEGWEASGWVNKWEIRTCLDPLRYEETANGYSAWFWGFNNIKAKAVTCVSFQGHSTQAVELVKKSGKRTVMLDRAETILHDSFGDANHWNARRSMRFAAHLIDVAAKFRSKFLNSVDETDGTKVTDDWQNFKPIRGAARGGPYLAVHLRRNDFLEGRKSRTPSLPKAAERIRRELQRLELKKVFIATDGSGADVGALRELLEPEFQLFVFTGTPERIKKFHAGGVAIIDQIICSHARVFIGTYESTFSFRIQEEREILGFMEDSTFNIFCGDENESCEGSTRWTIQYS